jgi:hypothetical protein
MYMYLVFTFIEDITHVYLFFMETVYFDLQMGKPRQTSTSTTSNRSWSMA